ncbi:hypothetical protein [Mycobacterium sp. SMC-4]|uniref:hypothetical protein n=1 Tax=Mycobacterium sp. SMC-4 TaxID=2857059 RepID=UPI0021B489AA|nr:hypothetical protein [Mycobacterium sp. SMC-4]UXA19072.1 hypothetical protein KXD98_05280 [Mycobacterium sp. SMC-4]
MREVTTAELAAAELAEAAFGAHPGRWPLPAADTAEQLWLRAVAAAGQGRYGSALTDLDRVRRLTADSRLASLAASTRGSFWRQLGWHDRARGHDGRAWALSRGFGEAGADALIGLAADALGVGRFAASQRALTRAGQVVDDVGVPRLAVRLAWVRAELAMVRGDGAGALASARRACELAEPLGSVRHRIKSDVVLAAAHCSAGDLDSARRVGSAALTATQQHALLPLSWAAASLLADIGSDTWTKAQVVAVRDSAAAAVIRWGGVWRSR